jgi:photosystem II stability/assembly factor-like uncharacterized protein
LRSSNQGATWTTIPDPGGQPVAVTSHPATPGRLFVSVEGGGVELSEDFGQSWRRQGQGLPDKTLDALAVSALQPDTLYAAISGDGLWRSEDAGESWEFVMDRPFLSESEQDVRTLASVDLASGMGGIWLYAGTTAGLQRVPDCFCRWQDVQPQGALDALVEGEKAPTVVPLPEGEPIDALVSCATAPERLYVALPSGVWASADGGVIWSKSAPLVATALAVDPSDADTLVAATPAELFHSRDGGQSWVASAML